MFVSIEVEGQNEVIFEHRTYVCSSGIPEFVDVWGGAGKGLGTPRLNLEGTEGEQLDAGRKLALDKFFWYISILV